MADVREHVLTRTRRGRFEFEDVNHAEVDLPHRRAVVVDEPDALLRERAAEFHLLRQLAHHEIGDVCSAHPWEATEFEVLTDAVIAGARAIRQRDGPHDRPLQGRGLNHCIRRRLVGIDAPQDCSKEKFLDDLT